MSFKHMKQDQERISGKNTDPSLVQSNLYNEYSGAQKSMNVQPVPEKAVAANEVVGKGKYILIAAGTYDLIDSSGENATIAGIPVENPAASIVNTGPNHDSISVAGWLVQDHTYYRRTQ